MQIFARLVAPQWHAQEIFHGRQLWAVTVGQDA